MSTITRKRHTFIVPLLALLAAAIALVAMTVTAEAVSVAPSEAEQERVAPNVGVVSDLSDHCGGAGDLALIETTSAGLPSIQPMPAYPGIGICYTYWRCVCTVVGLDGSCIAVSCWLDSICI